MTRNQIQSMPPPVNPPRRRTPFDHFGLLLIVGTYATSFFLPAIEVMGNVPGWEAFRFVLLAPFDSDTRPVDRAFCCLWWLPNPLLWAGVWLLVKGRRRAAAILGVVAFVLGLSCGFDPDHFLLDYRGYRIGYYVWLTSMVLLTTFSTVESP